METNAKTRRENKHEQRSGGEKIGAVPLGCGSSHSGHEGTAGEDVSLPEEKVHMHIGGREPSVRRLSLFFGRECVRVPAQA